MWASAPSLILSPAFPTLASPHRPSVIITWEGRTEHRARRTITVIGLETASTRFHCYSVEMVEDKISGVGAGAAAASDFRDAKSGLASSGLDGPESLKEPELGIPDDGDIEKVERVYRYVLSQFRNVVCGFLESGLESGPMDGRREAHNGIGKSIEGLYRVSLPAWSR